MLSIHYKLNALTFPTNIFLIVFNAEV